MIITNKSIHMNTTNQKKKYNQDMYKHLSVNKIFALKTQVTNKVLYIIV